MKASRILACLVVAFVGLGLLGCSVSVSGSAKWVNGKAIIEGKDAILVKAAQPEPPPPPPPPPKPKPVLKAIVTEDKIEITEKVMFEYNKAKIKVDSHQLLKDVGTVLSENLDITKIRIEGHTDGDGSARYNKKLSQKRANSVKDFLVQLGIDEGRLEAVGYGEDRPVASNDDDEGKEKNRRVEFNILAREKKEGGGIGVAKPAEEKPEEKPEDTKAEGGE